MTEKNLDITKILNQNASTLEAKVLKAIFKRNNSILDIIDILKPDMFSISDYSNIYNAMIELYKEDNTINAETVEMFVHNNGIDIDSNVIKKLYNESYTSLKIKDTALIIKELYQRRTMLFGLREIIENQEQTPTSSDEILGKINDVAMKLNDMISDEKNTNTKCCDNIDSLLKTIEEKLYKNVEDDSIKCGIPVIDNELGGLKRGRVFTIVADSQVGKSALACQIGIQSCLLNKNIYLDYNSLEMTKEECEERCLSNVTNIEPRYISDPLKFFNKFNEKTSYIDTFKDEKEIEDFKKTIKEGCEILKGLNINIYDDPELDVLAFKARCKKNHLKRGRTDIIIVDHVGIACAGTPQEVVGKMDAFYNVSKQIAKMFNCVVILLHQFNNEIDKDPMRFPNIFSLRGSSAPRHYSDVICAIYRPAVYPDLIKNNPDLKDVCQLVWQKVRYTAKPDTTPMEYNGFRFIQKTPNEMQGEIVSGNIFITEDGEIVDEE